MLNVMFPLQIPLLLVPCYELVQLDSTNLRALQAV